MVINKAKCAVQSLNVGLNFGCDVKRDRVMGVILAPRGFEVPLANANTYEDVLEYLQNAALSTTNRVLPLTRPLFGATDNTADPTAITSGYGNIYGYTDDPKSFQLEIDNYGYTWWKRLSAANMGNWSVYVIDKTFIEGQLTSTGFAGFDANIFVQKPQYDGTNGVRHYMNVTLNNPLAMGAVGDILQFPYDGYDISKELNGLTDLHLTATPGAGSVSVVVETLAGRTNVYDQYKSELSDPDAWKVYNVATGAVVPVTAVAANDATKSFSLSVTAGQRSVSLASPAELVALGVGSQTMGGYESNVVQVTVTGA